MNEKGMKELSPRDRNMLTDLLAKDDLSPTELAMLEARRDYLTEDSVKRLGLGAAPKKAKKKKAE